MSGLIPDLASWALRGGAGDENEGNEEADATSTPTEAEPTPEEMRARRLARMEAMAASSTPTTASPAATPAVATSPVATAASPVAISTPKATEPTPMEISPARKTAPTPKSEAPTKKAKESHPTDSKLQRKKELLLRKVLLVTLSTSHADPACVSIEWESKDTLSIHSIAEVLATRLSLSTSQLSTTPPQKPLLPYLAHAHRRASEELQTLQSAKKTQPELQVLLEEIQRQVVNYAATSLLEPDLFEQAQDGVAQLTKALLAADQTITVGTSGPTTSFYYFLCEEIHSQDKAILDSTIASVVTSMLTTLKGCESMETGVAESSPLGIVAALTALCSNKKAALALTELDSFLLPGAGTPQAAEKVNLRVQTASDLMRVWAGDRLSYVKRSGPALEKDTLLGMAFRISTPKTNSAFSPNNILSQSLDMVERTTNQQRQQLRVYQGACHQLVMALIKAGADARTKVLQWFTDCLLVNTGATAMRPDPTKVSSANMLLNVSVELLKLCDPFVTDERKHHLIDASFVSLAPGHELLFPTSGDDTVPRLGESTDPMEGDYTPKNAFIPQVFFLTARSLALGIVPMLSSHENLLRHISHQHWELTSNHRDMQSDPHFRILVSKQRSAEVALFQEEMIADTLRFGNLMSKVLIDLPDDSLRQMPEHFVDNICDVLMGIAKMKSRVLRGVELRHVFQLMVKLLSPSFATMVRNYNLRAMLGDVLYDVFLPTTNDDRRDIPTSVSCDPLAGGQTYLLSDPLAQKTLAPSLLLLYGEVEHTGYYDKMSHRAKISSLLKYLWESSEHRPAFREITQNKESFIKFANGIINETNTLLATVTQKLPEIRAAQEQMAGPEWGQLSEEEQSIVTSRLDDNEREVKHALPLCNKTLQMFGYLNTDADIRSLFLLGELCPRLVNMLLHVLGKLVGSKGLEMKVNNPEQYDFRPKEMLRDLCAIFALFAASNDFQVECAKSGCNPDLLRSAVRTSEKINLLTGESKAAFASLPDLVEQAARDVDANEAMLKDAPDEFLDEILSTFMMDPVVLPSGHFVDRSTITQHLLNDPIDPFNRESMTMEDVKPATELKARIDQWLAEKRAGN